MIVELLSQGANVFANTTICARYIEYLRDATRALQRQDASSVAKMEAPQTQQLQQILTALNQTNMSGRVHLRLLLTSLSGQARNPAQAQGVVQLSCESGESLSLLECQLRVGHLDGYAGAPLEVEPLSSKYTPCGPSWKLLILNHDGYDYMSLAKTLLVHELCQVLFKPSAIPEPLEVAVLQQDGWCQLVGLTVKHQDQTCVSCAASGSLPAGQTSSHFALCAALLGATSVSLTIVHRADAEHDVVCCLPGISTCSDCSKDCHVEHPPATVGSSLMTTKKKPFGDSGNQVSVDMHDTGVLQTKVASMQQDLDPDGTIPCGQQQLSSLSHDENALCVSPRKQSVVPDLALFSPEILQLLVRDDIAARLVEVCEDWEKYSKDLQQAIQRRFQLLYCILEQHNVQHVYLQVDMPQLLARMRAVCSLLLSQRTVAVRIMDVIQRLATSPTCWNMLSAQDASSLVSFVAWSASIQEPNYLVSLESCAGRDAMGFEDLLQVTSCIDFRTCSQASQQRVLRCLSEGKDYAGPSASLDSSLDWRPSSDELDSLRLVGADRLVDRLLAKMLQRFKSTLTCLVLRDCDQVDLGDSVLLALEETQLQHLELHGLGLRRLARRHRWVPFKYVPVRMTSLRHFSVSCCPQLSVVLLTLGVAEEQGSLTERHIRCTVQTPTHDMFPELLPPPAEDEAKQITELPVSVVIDKLSITIQQCPVLTQCIVYG
eukprot:m.231955 g.231955  ORF g.231955 m.231955 type:complete len:715 (+) comp17071_c1_seq5:1368-3512(+)